MAGMRLWRSRKLFNLPYSGMQGICQRSFAAAASYKNLSVDLDASSGIAVVTMKKSPVNNLNTELLQEISKAIKELESTKGCRAFVLTSSLPTVFSAGLDIMEMYEPRPEGLKDFWNSVQQVWLDLFGTRLATTAAITGHAPAGGCLLAMSCDYRIMAGPSFNIGLNETLLGIVAPTWFQDTMIHTIGSRKTEHALSLGKMFNTEEALKIGLIDEMVPTQQETVPKAIEELGKWVKIPDHARQATKQYMRQPIMQRLLKNREKDTANFVQFVNNDKVQKSLGLYLAALKGRKH